MALYTWLGIDYDCYLFKYLRGNSCNMTPWMKYNLPDGLWMLSFLLFIEGVWSDDKRLKLLFSVPIITFAVVWELLQYCGIFPGTGDVLDILFYLAAILLIILLIKLKQRYYEKNT